MTDSTGHVAGIAIAPVPSSTVLLSAGGPQPFAVRAPVCGEGDAALAEPVEPLA